MNNQKMNNQGNPDATDVTEISFRCKGKEYRIFTIDTTREEAVQIYEAISEGNPNVTMACAFVKGGGRL
jgi:hypothetical protein